MNKNSIYLIAFVLLSTFTSIRSQSSSEKIAAVKNQCVGRTECAPCIQTPNCAWCHKPDFGDRTRCFQIDLMSTISCPEEYVVNPQNELMILQEEHLSRGGQVLSGGGMESGGTYEGHASGHSSMSGSSSGSFGSSASGGSMGASKGKVVQISPQKVHLKMRINEKHTMTVNYAQAEDYPVDLYYLMDLSKSMEDDKEKLSNLGDLLSDTMRNITSNFRLGFGSFVDKVLMPYVSTVPKNLREPCVGCEAPYGYHNVMALNTDTRRFAANVKNAHVSGNLDAPEGGFDAIMQAVVCENEIGWRERARHLLVFSTDAGFHYAGDGKLGGVITPNDGACHMERNMYTHSLIQDYPSISQINLKVKQHSINIIFAVTAQQHQVYKNLSQHIEGSSSAVLSDDSSNVVDLVRDEYSKIKSSVEMKDSASEYVKVTYYSKCLGTERKQTNKCDGLSVGDVVSFETEIVVTSCPANKDDRRQKFKIYPVAVGEALEVDLEMLCSCDCETSGPTFELNSSRCSGKGTLSCGICQCTDAFYGEKCECSKNDPNLKSGIDNCRANATDPECTGQGSCVCGQCKCLTRENSEERFYGKYCECDNFSCRRHNGKLCSGPDHGICDCNECSCLPGWGGEACECSTSTDTCMGPNGQLCSGNGICKCGQCECSNEKGVRFTGTYCDKCPTCPNKCGELKDCVECLTYKKGPLKDNCAENCTSFTPIPLETINYEEERDEHVCTLYDEDECRYQFIYSETVEKNGSVTLNVRAQKTPDCPPKVFLLGIVLGVIAAIVLIGLAMLLLWKLLTTIHDRREFARFEKERMMAKWDTGENPIYKQATSTFKNPTYAGK